MYCSKCGSKIGDGSNFCQNCGNKITDIVTTDSTEKKPSNGTDMRGVSILLGVLSLVLVTMILFSPISFIVAVIGLILGIKAHRKINSTLAIVLNSIGLFLSLIGICLIGLVIRVSVSLIGNLLDKYHYITDFKDTTSESSIFGGNLFDGDIFDGSIFDNDIFDGLFDNKEKDGDENF